MAVFSISYDLQSQNYELLIDAIKSYNNWWHQTNSTWLIETNHSARQILMNLRPFIKTGDKLIVIKVSKNWSAFGHSKEEYDWLRNRNF